MSIETRRFDSVEAFLDVCGPFLEAREPEHQLTLGIVGDAEAHGGFPEDGALVVALRDRRVMATAIWTPPWNVILSEVDDEQALPAIADSLAAEDLGGVNGPAEHVEGVRPGVVRADRTQRIVESMRQRSYALDTVTPPRDVPGRLRRAAPGDRAVMTKWMDGFDREAMGSEAGRRDIDAMVDELINSSSRVGYIWDDPEPVSMCQAAGATPNGIRIGAVYTPPELRRRGYCQRAHRGCEPGGAGPRAALVLPVHGPGQSNLEPHLSGDRLPPDPGRRADPFRPALTAKPQPLRKRQP